MNIQLIKNYNISSGLWKGNGNSMIFGVSIISQRKVDNLCCSYSYLIIQFILFEAFTRRTHYYIQDDPSGSSLLNTLNIACIFKNQLPISMFNILEKLLPKKTKPDFPSMEKANVRASASA